MRASQRNECGGGVTSRKWARRASLCSKWARPYPSDGVVSYFFHAQAVSHFGLALAGSLAGLGGPSERLAKGKKEDHPSPVSRVRSGGVALTG